MHCWMNINPARLENQKSEVDELISILLPIYNSQEILSECLDSILSQTYRSFEVVVVDDGSTDDTPALLTSYAKKDSRIKIFCFTENRGIVEALNYGLDQCRGNWIARMDADDIMMPERLAVQLANMTKYPNIDLLGAQVRIFREDKALTEGQLRYQDWGNSLLTDDAIKLEIFAESPIMHPTFFLSKKFYGVMGGYQSNPWAEDYDFILRAFQKNAIFAKVPQVLVAKRDSPTRLARTDPRCKRKAMFNAKAHYFAQIKSQLGDRRIIIAGTGSSGRKACASLKRETVTVNGFVDNASGKENRTISGIPVETLNTDTAAKYFAEYQDCFFISCIGVPEGLEMIQGLFRQYHLKPGQDYIRFI